MGITIGKMYITLLAPVLSGIFNMVWCKLKILKKLNTPMDFGKNFIDGKRIFGDNKTWKGFVGYLLFNVIFSVGLGLLWNALKITDMNFFYESMENNVINNLGIGILLGLGYSLFELPNSFIKRRLDIKPGKTINGIKKVIFVFLDQADSVFGCCLVVSLFYNMTLTFYMLYVLLGAITHILLNVLLYFMRLRENMF